MKRVLLAVVVPVILLILQVVPALAAGGIVWGD